MARRHRMRPRLNSLDPLPQMDEVDLSFLPRAFPLNCIMVLPWGYISPRLCLSCTRAHVSRFARARNIVHEHERATIFVIVRADRDKTGARRIAIKPPRGSFIFFLRFPRALPGSSATLFSSFDWYWPWEPVALSDTILPPASEFSQKFAYMRYHQGHSSSSTDFPLHMYVCSYRCPPPFYVRARELVLSWSFCPVSFPPPSLFFLGLSFANSIPLIMQNSQISVISS